MNPAPEEHGFSVRPLTSESWPALEDLFGLAGASNGCWCMYWRLGPRYKDRPREDNRRDLQRLAGSGHPPGMLAFSGAAAVGWCELAPRHELGWLAHARGLQPVDDLPVWSVPCFYVRRSHRGRGVMGALIDGAVRASASAGAPALEAYPVDTAARGHTGNLFPGVASAFAERGFKVIARRRPDRPVMRLDLAGEPDRTTWFSRAAGSGRAGALSLAEASESEPPRLRTAPQAPAARASATRR